jgi:DNA-binding NtrC family response regulator
MSVHILQVAYDQGLLETRALMLKSRGYEVTSVRGNQQAMMLTPEKLAQFDAVLIGFSSTFIARSAILEWFKLKSPQLPVVVLQFHTFEKFPQADCCSLSEEPSAWLDAVADCLAARG